MTVRKGHLNVKRLALWALVQARGARPDGESINLIRTVTGGAEG
jgi:hypothetical protein